jgi:hypothetical protein
MQRSVAARNAGLDAFETTTGASAKLELRTGSAPMSCAATDSGTLLISLNLPADWMSAAASGVKALAGSWTGTASGTGTAGHFRFKDNAGTICHGQGLVTASVSLTTNALTAANGNVLNFASTTGVVVGMNVTGTGVPADTQVVAVGASTVTLSRTSTAGVANGASITFRGDIYLDSTSIASGQTVTVTAFDITAGDA